MDTKLDLTSPVVADIVRDFYDKHPYPQPIDNLDQYRRLWQDPQRRRADYRLFWPTRSYRDDYTILIAGCGTSQAAKHALRQPACHVVGIDISETSVRHTETLKRKYRLINLEVYQLPVERAGELGRSFDEIVCTGVLHHLSDPDAGLRALRDVLEPGGALHLMVYAAYGRTGVYMLQEYCRRLGIGHSAQEIRNLAHTLTALPHGHPLARLFGESPDFQDGDALADALLNPRDRAYTVPQLLDLLERCGLNFGRWVRQAPYLPQCGDLVKTPHTLRLLQLRRAEQYAAVELFRGTMVRHSLIAYRDDRPARSRQIGFDEAGLMEPSPHWPGYVPIRLPEAISVQERLPPGAAAVLINQSHTYTDLYLPIDKGEKKLLDEIDGKRTIAEIVRGAWESEQQWERARDFFERLWWYDQVVFDASNHSGRNGDDVL